MTACPNCGSRYLRPATPRNFTERINRLRFITPLRCLDCKHRFIDNTLKWSDLKWARCPVCLRPDLNGWTGKTFIHPPFMVALKVKFGAHRYRCEYCRLNFASFRPRKEIFSFKRWTRMTLPGLPGPAERSNEYGQLPREVLEVRPVDFEEMQKREQPDRKPEMPLPPLEGTSFDNTEAAD